MSTETMNILAVILSPVIAILVTLWYQSYKEKRDAKLRIFLTIMAYRRSYPISPALSDALNLIDVVFSDKQEIVRLWHEYYDLLGTKPDDNRYTQREHKFLELAYRMGKCLGYDIQQVDIDKFYVPQGQVDSFLTSSDLQKELLRVLKNTQFLAVSLKDQIVPIVTEEKK